MFALLLSANLHVHAMVNFGAILGSLSAAVQQVGEELQETEIFFAEWGYDSAQLENVLEQIGDLGEAAPIEKRILQLLRMSEQYNQPILEAFCVLLLSRFKENIEEISNAFMNSSLENEINTPGCSGRTVLMHMASLDTGVVDEDVLTRCCRKVIFSGADISLADKNGQTCLHFAAKKHDISLCKIFSTESYPTDKNGNTPLHLALLGESDDNAGDRRLETVQWLIKKYPNLIVKKNRSYWSPLHMACYFGYDDIVILLINAGASINEQITASGKTALMIACEKGFENICRILLLDRSLDITLRDKVIGNALDWAKEFGHLDICELLLASH
jgi:ankyrin repeat protein